MTLSSDNVYAAAVDRCGITHLLIIGSQTEVADELVTAAAFTAADDLGDG